MPPSARELLGYFVNRSHEFYGRAFRVYNIHGHGDLADDVEFLGSQLLPF